MPGFVPLYQNVIAMAHNANALNANGKWKYRNSCAMPVATATENIANP
jgi:hypothetical protein